MRPRWIVSPLLLLAGACSTLTGGPLGGQAGPGTAGPEESAAGAEVSEPYRIGTQDVLEVLVWKNEKLSRKVPVKPGGTISLPLLNEVRAAGLTPEELRQELTERYEGFVDAPVVSVLVVKVGTYRVSVIGEVHGPGQFELRGPATVLEALARAKGLTEFASGGSIHVIRKNGDTTERISFDYGDAIDGEPDSDFEIRPGDMIVVP